MPDVSGTLTKWKGRQLESTPITPYENTANLFGVTAIIPFYSVLPLARND
ncbi:Uncharacterized protein BM_BM9782 [Brugia malayi]|uniref:Bm9782 n=1 Tax=Brugia malayi TaxID=6279 RepID=A0A0J9XU28_BRUMA|nr:Uncharacterized protein BM_BM9782 [Brugia malayi]CDP95425.1 Bm9782 [Brugia malayi]VIO88086.1 Uncharacterized protein BM_BM9782 [Brugia malayi]